MRFVCISDTHNKLNRLVIPDGDVLIHAGDATGRGTVQELSRFNKEIGELPHPIKIFVPGNHDLGCEETPQIAKLISSNFTHYLVDESVEIDGVKIYGSPYQPEFCNWAFNLPRGEPLKRKWAQIPDDTNVLITHGPPYGILDQTPTGEKVGCHDLMNRIQELKELKMHHFGHIHHSYGIEQKGGVTFINTSICTEEYLPTNQPIVFDYVFAPIK